MDENKGQVLTVWLTPGDVWILEAIEQFRDDFCRKHGYDMKMERSRAAGINGTT